MSTHPGTSHLNKPKITLNSIWTVGALVVGLLVVATKDENWVGSQWGPSTAAKDWKVSLDSLDHWVYLCPLVGIDAIDLNVEVVFPITEDSSQFDQPVLAYCTHTRVHSRVFTGLYL